MKQKFTKQPVKPYEVWSWPEWNAFAERLGIPLDLPTKAVTIYIRLDTVDVEMEFVGCDCDAPAANET